MSSQEQSTIEHFSTRQRLISWISQRVFGNVEYTCRHGLLAGLKRKGGLGWLPASLSGSLEDEELRFWRAQTFTDRVVYDVGAYHGLLGLYFAKSAQQVVCFEPNDYNRMRLTDNVSINRMTNVHVRPVGIGASVATGTLVYSPLMTGAASIVPSDAPPRAGTEEAVRKSVAISTIDVEVNSGLVPPDFIKIDVEGLELAVLQGASQVLAERRPELFLEMHGNSIQEKRANVRAIVDFLVCAKYRILHIESGSLVVLDTADVAMEGHLFATPA